MYSLDEEKIECALGKRKIWFLARQKFSFICAVIMKQKYDLIFAKAYIYIFYETVCGKLTLAKRISETTKGTHKNLLF